MDSRRIQSEKAKAMIRYRRLRNVAKMWRILEFLVAFALLSWSSTRLPIIVSLAGQCLVQLSDYLFNPHINFVIGNAIIIVIVFLSRQNKAGNNSFTGDEYGNGEAHQRIASISDGATPTPPPPTAAEMEETAYEDKQIVVSENVVTQMQCDAASTAIEQAKKQIQRFQRTESEKLKRDLQANHRPQLRRSETEIKERSVVRRRAISSYDAVDRLNSDEFRRTVESFIAEQRRFLRTQKMDETNHFLIDAHGFECTGMAP
ncbi:uncharacterized protein LOC114271666 [Camellia sinensis]|uniref:uncharacterized protein LOC114271666 n=1 Tax=Camellia sinensis TaxID=4442 RepID=UPI001035A981|nr:uncharacterized protein LOC114271666 [Camellia sinensis]